MLRWLLALTTIAALGLAAWQGTGREGVKIDWKLFPEPLRKVEVQAVARLPITQKVMAPGHLQPSTESRLLPPFAANIAQVLVTEDQPVSAGQELIRLDDKPFRTALDGATRQRDAIRETYDGIREQFGAVEKQVKQWEAAYPAGTQAPAELVQLRDQLETIRKQADRLKTDFQAAEETCKNYRSTIDRCLMKAPHSGVVTQLAAKPGDIVGGITPPAMPAMPGGALGLGEVQSTALVTVAQTGKLVAKAWVDESDVALVRSGQAAHVTIQDEILNGKIERISAQGRRQGESIAFDATVSLDISPSVMANLRSGMSAMIEIDVRTRSNALSVPVQAVVQRRFRDIQAAGIANNMETKSTQNLNATGINRQKNTTGDPMRFARVVYVLRDNKAQAVPVEVGISDEEHVEILAGLNENDLVVTGPYQELDRLLDDTPVATDQPGLSLNRLAESPKTAPAGAVR